MNNIHTPADWTDIIRTATARTDKPFHVVLMNQENIADFRDMSNRMFHRPRASENVKMRDITEIKVHKEDPFLVKYKINRSSLEECSILRINKPGKINKTLAPIKRKHNNAIGVILLN